MRRILMLELSIDNPEELRLITHALSSEERLEMIRLLNIENMNVNQLAEELDIPVSTTSSHINILEKSGLIHTELRPASRGTMKICKRNFDDIYIQLKSLENLSRNAQKAFQFEMPIGQYHDFKVKPTCGMANREGMIIPNDEPVYFYDPKRTTAQIMWTREGFFEYRFPLDVPEDASIESIQLSLEICSEAPSYDHDWASDITVWLNDVEVGTWLSPGDFGRRPGRLNPTYWIESKNTQYGLLKTWKITKTESLIDDEHLSDVTINDLNLEKQIYLSFKIGIKEDAENKGGFNLFGREFGDYPQDIKLEIKYD